MNVIERLLFQEGYSFLLVCVILIFLLKLQYEIEQYPNLQFY